MAEQSNNLPLLDSTTVALGGSATYTGATKLAAGYSHIVGTVLANVAGTLNIDQSADGTNFDSSSSFAIVANTGQGFTVEIVAPFARLRYVNGGSAQATFRLYAFTRRAA